MAKVNKPKNVKAKETKSKKIKEEKYRSEEQTEMLRFIRILLIVIVLIVGVYLFTRIFVTKDLFSQNDTTPTVNEGSINYEVTLIGSLLNKPETEYYVIIYDAQNLRSVYYSNLITNYKLNQDALKVYFANLDNELNQKFYDPENVNVDITNISDLKVGDLTLIKVSNGAIEQIWTNEASIAEELQYIESTDTEN